MSEIPTHHSLRERIKTFGTKNVTKNVTKKTCDKLGENATIKTQK